MRQLQLLLALCLLSSDVLGDPAYPPVIKNLTGGTIHIVLRWANGPDQTGTVPANSSTFQRVSGRQLIGISIIQSNGKQRNFNETELDRRRRNFRSKYEIWVINSDGGLRLESK